MTATSALPALGFAPPPARAGTSAPESGAAAATADFAGLMGARAANVAVSAQAAVAADPGGALVATDDADADSDTDTGAAPPLLNWLFGLMASTGASLPPADDATDAVPADAEALISGPAVALAVVAAPLPAPPQAASAIAAGAVAEFASQERPTSATAAKMQPRTPASTAAESTPIAADMTVTEVPAELASLGVDAQTQADRPIAELLAPMAEAGADVLRDIAHGRSTHGMESALQSSLPAVNLHRASSGAANIPAPVLGGGVLNAMAEDFVTDLGEHIEWQLSDGIGEAKIELHPAELGALTVRIETQGDQARVHIVAAEAATRSLLNQAMPQLRELLAGSGMNLARSQVDSSDRREGRSGERNAQQSATPGIRRRVTQILLVDAYA